MISTDVVNAMINLIEENIRLIEEIGSQGYESFSGSFRDIQAANHSLRNSKTLIYDKLIIYDPGS